MIEIKSEQTIANGSLITVNCVLLLREGRDLFICFEREHAKLRNSIHAFFMSTIIAPRFVAADGEKPNRYFSSAFAFSNPAMSQQNRRVQQNTAAFPLLTAHDILECLAALDIPAQMEDLTKPTAQSTQSIYGSLLEVLMGASINSIEGPKQALLGMMEYKV